MDLRRLKTIFIFVLIAINAMLFAVFYSIESREREITEEMNQNVSAFLAKNMIFLAPKLDMPESPGIYNFYLEKMSESNEDFVTKVLGGAYTEKEKGVYHSGSKYLYVGGDEFRYENQSPEALGEEFTENSIESVCRKEMEKLGVKSELYKFGGVNYVEDNVKAIFTAQHDDSVFFDAYISFDISKDGIAAITGKNLISDISVSGRNAYYVGISSIMMDLVKNPIPEKNIRHTVMSIKDGYYIGRDTESYRNILAIPVWQIATDTGHILYYDARTGKYIEEQ